MSAFNNDGKDAIVEAIRELAESEIINGATPREVMEHIMEAIKYGVDYAMYEMEKTE